ncbi:MAG: acetyl-CoA acetyltransferase [Methanobacteriota archaeon]|jgi:acetyl-CoA C-acetyltransferase|nr:MAG: acetyl-CoA acetyltransferase [Euryarchaeota archaeon]
MRDVSIIGIGITKFGELWEKSLRQLGLETGLSAINDAGITSTDIDALYIGNMAAGSTLQQEHVSALMADYCGLTNNHVPATRVEAASASGGLAIRQAYMAIAGGFIDIAVVGGAEKMTDVSDSESSYTVSMGSDEQWESKAGATFASLHAMIAQSHIDEYGTTREEMSAVSSKNHFHASMNPMAQFPFKLSPEAVSNSGMVSSPLRMLDCAPNSDGAAAVVLCASDKSSKYTKKAIKIIGSGQASDTLSLHHRKYLNRMPAIGIAAKRAFESCNKKPSDLDLIEVHDNFTISEIIALEEIGIFKRGEAGAKILEGETKIGGKIPVNTSGGLKARGHAPGATGIAQVVEIVQQLRGEAGDRQVKNAKIGMVENHGGTAATAVVHILEGE